MPARASYQPYTVVKGDTLTAIAKRFGSTVAAIATASGVADPNKIKVGQQLLIPGVASDPDALDEIQVTAQLRNPTVMSSPKTAPAQAANGEVMLMDTANYLAEWMKPPKLWITLGVAAAAAYVLMDQGKRR